MLVELEDYDIRTIIDSAKLLKGVNKLEAKDIKAFKNFGDHTYIEVSDLLEYIENLNYELEHTQDLIQDMTNDLESNYKQISNWEMSGMSERDFY